MIACFGCHFCFYFAVYFYINFRAELAKVRVIESMQAQVPATTVKKEKAKLSTNQTPSVDYSPLNAGKEGVSGTVVKMLTSLDSLIFKLFCIILQE